MIKENLPLKLGILGVPKAQVEAVQNHLDKASCFVYSEDPGIEQGMNWLQDSLSSFLPPKEAQLLYEIALVNKPGPEVEYVEQGYDSCQSHRKIAKVVGEAILLGGLVYEADLLGIAIDLSEAKQLIDSELEIDPKSKDELAQIAQKFGAKQDFLFPGVTPSSEATPSLDNLAYLALRGRPSTTVRTLTGVGGLRYDQEWNYVTDWATFVELKIEEDKRYYPGIGIFYFLMKENSDSIPAMKLIKKAQPEVYAGLLKFAETLKSVPRQEFSGVSILCSAYLPPWHKIKKLIGWLPPSGHLELAESFHSPAYDFVVLVAIFEQLHAGHEIDLALLSRLAVVTKKLDRYWSFNSTIHLPWTTAELASLSYNLIDKITNQFGDYCIRYGIGYQGRSLEVREYHFGKKRKFPAGARGKVYEVRAYSESKCFVGPYDSHVLKPKHLLWQAIEKGGFMKAGLEFLERR